MKKGIFITIEGPDGAGKSTQIPYIKKLLEDKGYDVLLTREPGGTIIGEKIRDLLLDKNHKEMSFTAEALLYAASRAQHVTQVIAPALEEGKAVICDRFVDSSIVYQGKGRGLGIKAVEEINRFATSNLEPDLTILLDINPEEGLNRVRSQKQADRIEEEKLDFHKRVYEGYIELLNIYPERIKMINGNKPIEEVSKEIENQLKILLKGE